MHHVQEMLQSHPRPAGIDKSTLADTIHSLFDCAQTCTACADACLGEAHLKELVRCIRLNLDCSDVCLVTGNLLSRQTEPDWTLLSDQLAACVTACRLCGEECERHADMHEHCRICAEACQECENLCSQLLAAIPSGVSV